jgi:hypothetical protein
MVNHIEQCTGGSLQDLAGAVRLVLMLCLYDIKLCCIAVVTSTHTVTYPPLPLIWLTVHSSDQHTHTHTHHVSPSDDAYTGLLVARSASCGTPKLPAGDQQHALAALLQQLLHHTGPAADGVPVGSGAGVGAARSGPRNAALAGAAALALGYAGLTGAVELPGLALDSDGAVQPSGTSEDTTTTPQLLSALLSLAASGRDARAAQRAVTAVGFIAAGSTDTRLHMAAAKGMTLHSKHVCLHTYMAARCSSHRHVLSCMCVYVSILWGITAPPGCGQGTDECRPQYA